MKKRLSIIILTFILLLKVFSPINILASPEGTNESEQESIDEENAEQDNIDQENVESENTEENILSEDIMQIESTSAVLIEGSTGEIIYEKNKDERLHPASITKIMTMLLIFEAIDEGRFKLDDEVTVSEHAASLGGSQVYLEPGEIQTVETMIKCIAIASANDASAAMS